MQVKNDIKDFYYQEKYRYYNVRGNKNLFDEKLIFFPTYTTTIKFLKCDIHIDISL